MRTHQGRLDPPEEAGKWLGRVEASWPRPQDARAELGRGRLSAQKDRGVWAGVWPHWGRRMKSGGDSCRDNKGARTGEGLGLGPRGQVWATGQQGRSPREGVGGGLDCIQMTPLGAGRWVDAHRVEVTGVQTTKGTEGV